MLAKPATFLDANAGAPLHPRVAEALLPLLNQVSQMPPVLANPSSIHSAGRKARALLQRAREQVSKSLGSADPSHITFTSCGTESIQLAIQSVLEHGLLEGRKVHLITTPVEHEATVQAAEWIRSRGGRVTELEIDSQGRPKLEALKRAFEQAPECAPEDTLVSVIWVNNETGVITDVEALAREVRARGARLHLDGAQAWGKLPIDLKELGAHLVSFSAHKIGGLAGTGVLWNDPCVKIECGICGKQEQGRRGGTENLMGIYAAGVAASLLMEQGSDHLGMHQREMERSRDHLEKLIRTRIPGVHVNGEGAPRVANTLNISIEGLEKAVLVQALDLEGFAVSAGSACSSGVPQPSRVLLALGRSEALASSSLRISMLEPLSEDLAESLVSALERQAERSRRYARGIGASGA